ncbi:MAG TPA: transcriptional regulator [Ruminococcaceae bacterium]|nr:transcriptional regulator [Oscillospiraceae bacterium]
MKDKKKIEACNAKIKDSFDFDFYKTLFDPVRVEILVYLASHGKQSIKEIAENFSQDRSVISRHLDLLYRYKMVHKTKESRHIYYEVDKALIVEKFEGTTKKLKELIAAYPKKK